MKNRERNSAFFQQNKSKDSGGLTRVYRNARESGKLNLSSRSLTEIPDAVFSLPNSLEEGEKFWEVKYVCMHICVYICIHVYKFVYIVYMQIYMYIYVCINMDKYLTLIVITVLFLLYFMFISNLDIQSCECVFINLLCIL
jgi:hypothetical protein